MKKQTAEVEGNFRQSCPAETRSILEKIMARGVNKVILVGNLGRDPETRYMPSGGAVTNVTIATSESWRDRQSGEQQERTEWHRVVFFNKLAEIAGEYLRKGSQVYVEGSLRTRKWTDQSGQERYTTEIVANEMQMLGGRQGMGGGDFDQRPAPPQQSAHYNSPQQGHAERQQSAPPQQPANQGAPAGGFDDFDDDIPF